MNETLISIAQYMKQQACIVEEPRNRGHYDAVVLSAAYARQIEAACRKAQQDIDALKAERDAALKRAEAAEALIARVKAAVADLSLRATLSASLRTAHGVMVSVNEIQVALGEMPHFDFDAAGVTQPDIAAPTPKPQPQPVDGYVDRLKLAESYVRNGSKSLDDSNQAAAVAWGFLAITTLIIALELKAGAS